MKESAALRRCFRLQPLCNPRALQEKIAESLNTTASSMSNPQATIF